MRAEREDKQRTWEQEDQKGGRQEEGSEGKRLRPGRPSPSELKGFACVGAIRAQRSPPREDRAEPCFGRPPGPPGFTGCARAELHPTLCPPDPSHAPLAPIGPGAHTTPLDPFL